MRYAMAIFALTTMAAAADRPRDSSALLTRALGRVESGDAIVELSRKVTRDSTRIRRLVRAKPYYREARALAHRELRARTRVDATVVMQLERVERRATAALVEVLNAEAEYHFGRTSTGRAKRLNEEALKLMPRDGRALQLARDIRNAANGGDAVSRR